MKIYLAGSFASQRRLRPHKDKLFHMGHAVVGSWLDEIDKPDDMPKDIFDKKLAVKDLQEVKEADCFLIDTIDETTTGGRMVELGFALAHSDKLVYQVGVGKSSNSIFLKLVDKAFETWDDLYSWFESHHVGSDYVATGMEGKEFSEDFMDGMRQWYEELYPDNTSPDPLDSEEEPRPQERQYVTIDNYRATTG